MRDSPTRVDTTRLTKCINKITDLGGDILDTRIFTTAARTEFVDSETFKIIRPEVWIAALEVRINGKRYLISGFGKDSNKYMVETFGPNGPNGLIWDDDSLYLSRYLNETLTLSDMEKHNEVLYTSVKRILDNTPIHIFNRWLGEFLSRTSKGYKCI